MSILKKMFFGGSDDKEDNDMNNVFMQQMMESLLPKFMPIILEGKVALKEYMSDEKTGGEKTLVIKKSGDDIVLYVMVNSGIKNFDVEKDAVKHTFKLEELFNKFVADKLK